MCNNNSFFAIPGVDGLKIEKITDTSMIARPASVNMHTVTLIIQTTSVSDSTPKRICIWQSANMCMKGLLYVKTTCEYQVLANVHFVPFLVSLILEIDIVLFIMLIKILKILCIICIKNSIVLFDHFM